MKKAVSVLLVILMIITVFPVYTFAGSIPYFDSYSDAVEYVTEAMTAREELIQFEFSGYGFVSFPYDDVFAFDHNNSDAGDYLRLNTASADACVTEGKVTVTASYFTTKEQEDALNAYITGNFNFSALEGKTAAEKTEMIFDYVCGTV